MQYWLPWCFPFPCSTGISDFLLIQNTTRQWPRSDLYLVIDTYLNGGELNSSYVNPLSQSITCVPTQRRRMQSKTKCFGSLSIHNIMFAPVIFITVFHRMITAISENQGPYTCTYYCYFNRVDIVLLCNVNCHIHVLLLLLETLH